MNEFMTNKQMQNHEHADDDDEDDDDEYLVRRNARKFRTFDKQNFAYYSLIKRSCNNVDTLNIRPVQAAPSR